MSALLDRAVASIRALPSEEQDVLAAMLLSVTDPNSVPPLDETTRLAIRDGLAQAERGDFASDQEIAALLAYPYS